MMPVQGVAAAGGTGVTKPSAPSPADGDEPPGVADGWADEATTDEESFGVAVAGEATGRPGDPVPMTAASVVVGLAGGLEDAAQPASSTDSMMPAMDERRFASI